MSLEITGLYVYPIKSLGGISLLEAEVSDRGLMYDRRWMLVGEDQVFLSQRSHPVMALLRPEIQNDALTVYAPSGDSIRIKPKEEGQMMKVQVWDDVCDAYVYGAEVNDWFSDQLGMSARLVYMHQESRREVDPRYATHDEIVSFADGYPFLMISEESLEDLNGRLETPIPMDRFRPNIVVRGGKPYQEDEVKKFEAGGVMFTGAKPCARCQVITIDQQTAVSSKEPLKTLATYRRSEHKVLFGMNLLHQGSGTLRVGEALEALRFSH